MLCKLTNDEYKILKEKAYKLAAELSEQNIDIEQFNAIIEKEKNKIDDENAKEIFEYTVKYPNDMELIWEIANDSNKKNNEFKNSHDANSLSKKLNWPLFAVLIKQIEIGKYDLVKILSENAELRKLAEQAPFYEIKSIKK